MKLEDYPLFRRVSWLYLMCAMVKRRNWRAAHEALVNIWAKEPPRKWKSGWAAFTVERY